MSWVSNKIVNSGYIFLNNILLLLKSLTWKRDESVVLFGAWFGNKFADNSRFLFQYLSDNKEKYNLTHVIWVTRSENIYKLLSNMDYEVYMIDSEESIYYHKLAKYHIVCNAPNNCDNFTGEILGKYSYGAKRINLWHGIPLKGVSCASNEYLERKNKYVFIYAIKEFLNKNCSIYRKLFVSEGGWGDCCYLSTTKYVTEKFKMCFLLPQKKYIESHYPRNCKCIKLTNEEIKVIKKMQDYSKTILYLPTFRNDGGKFVFSKLAIELRDVLKKENILWISKSHSADLTNITYTKESENVLELNPNFDINVILPYISVLVTDYSSVMFDVMYQFKPILFFVPDFEEYKNGDRGILKDAEENMCGPKLFTVDELINKIENIDEVFLYTNSDEYKAVRKRFWNDNKNMDDIWMDIKYACD